MFIRGGACAVNIVAMLASISSNVMANNRDIAINKLLQACWRVAAYNTINFYRWSRGRPDLKEHPGGGGL